jgi:hypothetical protein
MQHDKLALIYHHMPNTQEKSNNRKKLNINLPKHKKMEFLASRHHKNQDIMWITVNVDIGPEEKFRANPSYTQKRKTIYQ